MRVQRSSCAVMIVSRANGSSWRPARRSVTWIACVFDQSCPADVAAHDPDDAVADLVTVDQHLRAVLQQVTDLAVQRLEVRVEMIVVERAMAVRQLLLVVVVQVVGCGDDRNHAAETVLPQPDDLLLAADPTMAVAHAARTLADRQLVLEDPGEVPRRDAEGPLATQSRWHQASRLTV
jgi:hypothetical protein